MARRLSRMMPTLAALVVAAGVYLATPPAPRAASGDCGAGLGPVCRLIQYSDCVKLFCFRITLYYRYDT